MSPRPRLFHIGLTLMGLAARAEIAGAQIEKVVEPTENQRTAAAFAARSMGGQFERRYVPQTKRQFYVFALPPGAADSHMKLLPPMSFSVGVDLSGTNVTNDGLKELIGLPRLSYLILSRAAVTEAGIKELLTHEQMVALDLSGVKVSDAGVRSLVALKNLEWLELASSAVGDAGVAIMPELPNLEVLGLAQTRVNSILPLAQNPKLRSLDLRFTPVGDDVLDDVATFPRLSFVFVGGTRVSPKGIGRLQKAFPKCRVY